MTTHEQGRLQPGRIVIPSALLALAATSSHFASRFIDIWSPERPTPRDLLFEHLPYVDIAQYVSDIAVFSAIALLAYYAWTRSRQEIPKAISAFAIMYLLRSAMIVLTPLSAAHGSGAAFGFIPYVQNGMWPSGHTGATLLAFLLIDAGKAPNMRRLALGLGIVEWASLLLARGHYSIDIIGGLLLSYFVYHEWTYGHLFDALKRRIEPSADL